MHPRVTAVHYQSPHKLILTSANKEVMEFDFSNYLNYPVYQILKDESYSQKAKVFNGTVTWDELTDFDPDTLYLESRAVKLA